MEDRLTAEERYVLVGVAIIAGATICWWLLALWPLRQAVPDWLARTRAVCFGVNHDGLPDVGGWIVLLGQPVGMSIALLVGWGEGVSLLVERVRRSTTAGSVFSAVVICVAALVAMAAWRVDALWAARASAGAAEGAAHSYTTTSQRAPALELIDQHGVPRSLASLRGKRVLVGFVYAHCETVCPLLVFDILNAQKIVRGRAQDVTVLLVTLDPWRDTPARLPHIAAEWRLPAEAFVLSGDVSVVQSALERWGVARQRDEQTGEITHTTTIYLVDREGVIRFTAAGDAGVLAHLTERL